jgi:alcohol dehydrogenase (cytochrome c)
MDPAEQWAGWITAIEADRGTVAWKRKLPAPVLGAVTPTAGGVVFAGDVLGNLYAFDASTGTTVCRQEARTSIEC